MVNLLEKILHANGSGSIERQPLIGADLRPDLIVRRGDRVQLIEVTTVSPQTKSRLFGVLEQLRHFGDYFQAATGTKPQLVLFTPGVLSKDNIRLFNHHDIAVYDKVWLLDKARSAGLFDEALALLESDKCPSVVEPPFVRRLKTTAPGKSEWKQYQRLCLEIFNHLFSPPLNKGLSENENAVRVNRRDIIMPNYATEGFWYYVRQTYRADHIVIDAKNYTESIGKEQVLQLANYLSQHGTGLFGIILTRTDDDRSAQYIRREQWMSHNKMIIVLNDGDLIQMLSEQAGSTPPEALIQQKIEDFRLDI